MVTVLVVVEEYEEVVGAEASRRTVMVVIDLSEVLDPSSPHSFQPDQSPRIGSYLGKSSGLRCFGLPSLVKMKGPTLSYTSYACFFLAISTVTRAPGRFHHSGLDPSSLSSIQDH